ncbi:hypothetical protein A1Q1_00305 [Trichosporon asahii var. asahii CBS 2479]|uniref:ER-bound oxygenase mpaB/mpaB'/Rubber oxygenase catalytic domain-containing protein n=1 Tax=Trichosporon asahii var. asahii (strain ATCC 90039 / CBS 2479 / JCM 2466 / KCTC 7840 / NBRC 103889/ NCYC 2677 / UAMH 7654) TaxID=1186058 RepID=J8TIC5_TRIAS|nr:hypothetical protein A1Q1_00305 [Trichosporon asahii var. asahii CBS 2479]EJT52991.1 hypothetical protein A1Q1_00305 [Trichosporon asahii var. asahii CBS 2479]
MAAVATTTATEVPTTDGAGLRRRLDVHIHDTIEDPAILREMIVEDIYLLGGQFAILCQFAHPGIARGTAGHSTFASRIPERLRNTARFLNASVFGTEREKKAIFSVIHKYHAQVNGEVNGERYDANDPELHLWTAATLFVSLVLVHERLFGKISQERMEAMYRQSAVFGTSLRMPPEMWPKTLDDFWVYWDHMIATLEVTPEAKRLSRDLLWPKNLPWNMQAIIPLSRIVTKQLLPPRLQREYDLHPSTLDWIQYQAAINSLSFIYPYFPDSIRQRRHNMYMEDLKAAVARVEKTGHWGRDKDFPA